MPSSRPRRRPRSSPTLSPASAAGTAASTRTERPGPAGPGPIPAADGPPRRAERAPLWRRSWRRPWPPGLSILAHALIIAAALIGWQTALPPPDAATPPGVAVVFENGGEKQAQTPTAPTRAPVPTLATRAPSALPPPPPAAPAPPQPPAPEAPPEVNLNLPPLASAPPLPRPLPRPPARPARPPAPRQHYLVLNGMSYGRAPNAAPARPTPRLDKNALDGMDFSPAAAAKESATSEFALKGRIGADWQAALSKWVNEHSYYPQAAAEQGQEGNVTIHLKVRRDGTVESARLVRGSGSNFLDLAWLDLFRGVRLPPFPPGTERDSIDFDATMSFELIR